MIHGQHAAYSAIVKHEYGGSMKHIFIGNSKPRSRANKIPDELINIFIFFAALILFFFIREHKKVMKIREILAQLVAPRSWPYKHKKIGGLNNKTKIISLLWIDEKVDKHHWGHGKK